MKHLMYKQLISIILSIYLASTSVPAHAGGKSSLAVPGDTELNSSLIESRVKDTDSAQNGSGELDKPLKEIIIDITDKSNDDLAMEIAMELDSLPEDQRVFFVLKPQNAKHIEICSQFGFKNIYIDEVIIEKLTKSLKREKIKIERVESDKESGSYDYFKLILPSGSKINNIEIKSLILIPENEDTLGRLAYMLFKSKESLSSALHGLAHKSAAGTRIRYKICGIPVVLKNEKAKNILLGQLPLVSDNEKKSAEDKIITYQEFIALQKIEKQSGKKHGPKSETPSEKETKDEGKQGKQEESVKLQEVPIAEGARKVKTAKPVSRPKPVKEISEEKNEREKLEECLRPFYKNLEFSDGMTVKEIVGAYRPLKKLLLTSPYKQLKEHAIKRYEKEFSYKGWKVDPETLEISGNIDQADGTVAREFMSYREFVYMVRKVMITWDSLDPPAGFTDNTPIKHSNIYGSEHIIPSYGDYDWRGSFDWVVKESFLRNIKYLEEFPFTKRLNVGLYKPRDTENKYLYMADHWTARKLGFSHMFTPVQIAQMLIDYDIKDVQVVKPYDSNVTPCCLKVTLGKEYSKSRYIDLHHWYFFLLNEPLKDSSEESEEVLDNIEAFKQNIEHDSLEYERLVWRKGDAIGNIKRAEKLFSLARHGRLLSTDYWIANKAGADRLVSHLKGYGLASNLIAKVKEQLERVVAERVERLKKSSPKKDNAGFDVNIEKWLQRKRLAALCLKKEPDEYQKKRISQLAPIAKQIDFNRIFIPVLKSLLLATEEKGAANAPDWLINDQRFRAIVSSLQTSLTLINQFCVSVKSFLNILPDEKAKEQFLTACALELPYFINMKKNKVPLIRLRHAAANLDEYRDFERSSLNAVSPDKVYELFAKWIEKEEFSRQERGYMDKYVKGILGILPITSIDQDLIKLNADYVFVGLVAGLRDVVKLYAGKLGGDRDETYMKLIREIVEDISKFYLPEKAQQVLAKVTGIGMFSTKDIDQKLCHVLARLEYPALAFYPGRMLEIINQAKEEKWTPDVLNESLKKEEQMARQDLAGLNEISRTITDAGIRLIEAYGAMRKSKKQADIIGLNKVSNVLDDIGNLHIKDEELNNQLAEARVRLAKDKFDILFNHAEEGLRNNLLEALEFHVRIEHYDEASKNKAGQLRSQIEAKAIKERTQALNNINVLLNQKNFELGEEKINAELKILDEYEKYGIVIDGRKKELNDINERVKKQKEIEEQRRKKEQKKQEDEANIKSIWDLLPDANTLDQCEVLLNEVNELRVAGSLAIKVSQLKGKIKEQMKGLQTDFTMSRIDKIVKLAVSGNLKEAQEKWQKEGAEIRKKLLELRRAGIIEPDAITNVTRALISNGVIKGVAGSLKDAQDSQKWIQRSK